MRAAGYAALFASGVGLALALSRRASASSEAPPLASPFPELFAGQARLTEYHPDAPASQRQMEGGPRDCKSGALYTIEQHRASPELYPYVSVSSDIRIFGVSMAYGTRVYFDAFPGVVFRIVDTGCHFVDAGTEPGPFSCGVPAKCGAGGPKKVIRDVGYEPFDIATAWATRGSLGVRHTRFRLDPTDRLPIPRRRPAVA